MNRQSSFSLSKWYLDCVTEAGDVFIGYVAALRWRRISIKYSSTLLLSDGLLTSNTTMRHFEEPVIGGPSITWSNKALAARASWEAVAPPVELTIFESGSGNIIWKCLQPRSRVTVRCGNDDVRGVGYVEHLFMDLPPWQLPLSELRWGRFISEDTGIVWIDWQGPHPLRVVLRDGEAIEASVINEDGIKFENGQLTVHENGRMVLRDGKLVNTALSMIPGIHRLFPARILNARETKWRSLAEIETTVTPKRAGWTIHEVVGFDQSAQ